jgi:uncharacterized protein YndB with AHSA1/START domain
MNDKAPVLTKEIFIECSPKTLFSFFIHPDKMVRWIGQQVLLEPRIGGIYRIDINGENIALGEYREITPYEKVVLTWGWEGLEIMPPGSSTVEFLLSPQDSGTLLTLNHFNIPIEKMTSNDQGWAHYMTRLQRLAEGQNIEPDPWGADKK